MSQPTEFPTIFTKRLQLRQLRAGDEQAIFQLRSNRSVNRFLERKPAKSLQDGRLFIEKVNNNFTENQLFYWGICLKTNGQLIGTICFFDFVGAESSAEIGFELSPTFQGKGFMGEAVSAAIGFAAANMDCEKITAFVDKMNSSSIRLLQNKKFLLDESFLDDRYLKLVLPI